LHDERGNRIPLHRIVTNGGRALASSLARVAFGYRPSVPWISYSALRVIRQRITGSSVVLEYGAGHSTIYWGMHARQVYAVEDDRKWVDKVGREARERGLGNVTVTLASGEGYWKYMVGRGLRFDLIVVDGSYRDQCVACALDMLCPNGMLYLDNSDKTAVPGGDPRAAVEMLLKASRDRGARLTCFTDFSPGSFFASEGILLQV
jgi:hypothetical protein